MAALAGHIRAALAGGRARTCAVAARSNAAHGLHATWFNLSDPAMEDALYDSESMRRFAAIDPGADVVPDESTILRFRHLLEDHQLTERVFQEVRALLEKSATAVEVRHDRGRNDYCCATVDQERYPEPRPGDEQLLRAASGVLGRRFTLAPTGRASCIA